MSFGSVLGYAFDGAIYCCIECLPSDVDVSHEEVSVILEGQGEWDHYPTCETCDARIDEVTLTSIGNRNEAERHLEAVQTLWHVTEQLGFFVTRVIRKELLDHLDQARTHIENL